MNRPDDSEKKRPAPLLTHDLFGSSISVEKAAKFFTRTGIRLVNPSGRIERRKAISGCLRKSCRHPKTMQRYRSVNVWSEYVVPTVDILKNRIVDETVWINDEVPSRDRKNLALDKIDHSAWSCEGSGIALRVAKFKLSIRAQLANWHSKLRHRSMESEGHAKIDRKRITDAAPSVVSEIADGQHGGVISLGADQIVTTSDVRIQSQQLRHDVGVNGMLPAIPSAVHPAVSGSEWRDRVEVVQLGGETLPERAFDIHGDFLPNVRCAGNRRAGVEPESTTEVGQPAGLPAMPCCALVISRLEPFDIGNDIVRILIQGKKDLQSSGDPGWLITPNPIRRTSE